MGTHVARTAGDSAGAAQLVRHWQGHPLIDDSVELEQRARYAYDQKMLLAILIRQQAILAESMHWTRVALARTAMLEPVLPLSTRAWSWSLSGALALALFEALGEHVARRDWQRLYDLAIDALWNALPDEQPRTGRRAVDLDGFNDYLGTDFRDVADLVDRVVRAQSAWEDRQT